MSSPPVLIRPCPGTDIVRRRACARRAKRKCPSARQNLDNACVLRTDVTSKRRWGGLLLLASSLVLLPLPLTLAARALGEIPADLRPAALALGFLACFSFAWNVTWKTWTGVSWFKLRGDADTPRHLTVIWLAGALLSIVLSTLIWKYAIGWSWMRDGYVEALRSLLTGR